MKLEIEVYFQTLPAVNCDFKQAVQNMKNIHLY